MSLDLLSIELPLRLAAALFIFAVMAGWEMAHGLRVPRVARGPRWLANLGLVAIDSVLVRLVLPAGLVGAALWVEQRWWGLLPNTGLPRLAATVIAVVALDLAVYLQHVLFHAVPTLWRFHRVHHADHDVDVTTGLRFHPVEILLSLGLKLGLVAVLGVPAEAVLVFEVLLNGTSIFNHANVSLPIGIDRALRLILVTPDMHRVHHSVERPEHDSNFGFNLTWWDRLLGTYRLEAAAGREGVQLGLREVGPPRLQSLSWMLLVPFARRRDTGPNP
jgi:sterol desaturase/sphingolipid hydroxylase (fatty acid hydroxylase superfamily)